jgi:hypothetical protein
MVLPKSAAVLLPTTTLQARKLVGSNPGLPLSNVARCVTRATAWGVSLLAGFARENAEERNNVVVFWEEAVAVEVDAVALCNRRDEIGEE